ncbi:SMP-30/gluconolactonase/LRE family protein [Saccharopolyspora sp. CA-218241]|uniref:SMP-30/gluconolactonase/LRE family protein n=1 Tax=Saccharopolyspora sp. CA-218241 TaxID=3240027 RepID=UPI003D96EC64
MGVEVDIAVRAQARRGGAPTWDVRTDTVLWVDGPARSVHRFTPGRADHEMDVPQLIGAGKPRSLGGLVLHLDEGIALFESTGTNRTWLVYWAREGVTPGATAIDGKGRLWATTISPDRSDGWLARVSGSGSATIALSGLTAVTGLDWSPDGALMYLAVDGRLDVLDHDLATGEIAARRPLCEVGEALGGMCVDADGGIWVALREAGELRRFTPDGALDRTAALPARRPTGCCFGGEELTDLYVTTARDGVDEPGEADGALLVLPDAGTGLRPFAFAG